MAPEDVDRLLFADLLAEEDLEPFMAVLNSQNGNSPNRAQVLAVYGWLMEVASGKVRSSEETSSDG